MQNSPLRHPVAVVRKIIGLGQKELADLVGRSRRTIQAIELGSLRLGVDLADVLARETGTSLPWLLRADADAPPLNAKGETYTKRDFELVQGAKLQVARPVEAEVPSGTLFMSLWNILPLIMPMAAASACGDKTTEQFALYKLDKFFREFREEFGWPKQELVDYAERCRFTITDEHGYRLSLPGSVISFEWKAGVGIISERDFEKVQAICEAENPAGMPKRPKSRKAVKGAPSA